MRKHARSITGVLHDYEFRKALGEAWELSSETGNMHAFPVYLPEDPSQDGMIIGPLIEGTNDRIKIDTPSLVIEGLDEFGMPLYLLIRTDTSEGHLVPTPVDLHVLSDIRKFYTFLGIHMSPIGGVVRFEPYGDVRSLKILLYKERTAQPIFADPYRAESAKSLVTNLHNSPHHVQAERQTAFGKVEFQRRIGDSDIAHVMDDKELGLYHARLVPYHRDLRVGNIPYTWGGIAGFDTRGVQ